MDSSKLGFVVDLRGRLISDLQPEEFYKEIANNLWKHGVICVKNQQNLSKRQLVYMATRMGEGIKPPRKVAIYNHDPDFPEIVRVGNLSVEGEIMEKYFRADHWHSDGASSIETQNYYISWLHSQIIPEKGGETAFVDTRHIYSQLDEKMKETLHKSKYTLRLTDIPIFKDVDPELIKEFEFMTNNATTTHYITGEPIIYLGGATSNLKYEDGREEKLDKIIDDMVAKTTVYIHKWEEGDLLIWDNLLTMHKGMEGYTGLPRLLNRVQVKALPFDIATMKTHLDK